jgi:hypothetical protein
LVDYQHTFSSQKKKNHPREKKEKSSGVEKTTPREKES